LLRQALQQTSLPLRPFEYQLAWGNSDLATVPNLLKPTY
jgi:hypothetical protein